MRFDFKCVSIVHTHSPIRNKGFFSQFMQQVYFCVKITWLRLSSSCSKNNVEIIYRSSSKQFFRNLKKKKNPEWIVHHSSISPRRRYTDTSQTTATLKTIHQLGLSWLFLLAFISFPRAFPTVDAMRKNTLDYKSDIHILYIIWTAITLCEWGQRTSERSEFNQG